MDPAEPNSLVDRVFGDRYLVIAALGTGSIASVFVAEDLERGGRVALKVFDQTIGEDPAIVDRLVAAIEQAAALDHPNIARVLGHGVDGVRLWVASELCVGGSLRAMLDQGLRLSPSQALVVALETARGLVAGHEAGVPHGNLRPENIVFSADNRVRIADYGLTPSHERMAMAPPSRVLDSIRYEAPEQAAAGGVDAGEVDPSGHIGEVEAGSGEEADAAPSSAAPGRGLAPADLYALALIANEAVSGLAPTTEDTAIATRAARAAAPLALSSELGAMRSPLERCSRVDPAERPDAEELTIALLAVAEVLPRPEPLPVVGLPLQRTSADAVVGAETALDSGEVVVPGLDELDAADSAEPTADLASDAGVTAGPPTLVSVPDVIEASAQVRIEDLSVAEPVFADGGHDADAADAGEGPLDVPVLAGQPDESWEPDEEDLDDDLPKWPLVVLLAGIGLAMAAWFLGVAGGAAMAEVPDLVGRHVEDLETLLEDNPWTVELLETRQNGTDSGEVVAQDPLAGVELTDDATLVITVSLGNEMVEIPADVAGLTLDQAQARLAEVGLVVGAVTEEQSEAVAAGLVVAIDEPTRQKPQGEAVSLRMSSGPEDRVVPDAVLGASIGDATGLLAGLRLQAVEEQVYDPVAEPGTVLGSSPAPGQSVPADSQVTLFVSAGPEPIAMPDLAGLSLAEALSVLEAHGLAFLDTQGTAGEPVESTIPPAGVIVDIGSEVIIVLADPVDDAEGEDGQADAESDDADG